LFYPTFQAWGLKMKELMFQFPVVTSAIGALTVGVTAYYLVMYIQSINFDFGNKTKKSVSVDEPVTSTYLVWEGNRDGK
jgi:hypothetical protein